MLPLVEKDPWLRPVAETIEKRHADYLRTRSWIEQEWGSLYAFASAHLYFGLHYEASEAEKEGADVPRQGEWVFREWLPHARHVFFLGDFNAWDQTSHALQPVGGGVWEIRIRAGEYPGLCHLSRYKLYIHDSNGQWAMRMPAYAFYALQEAGNKDFSAVVWNPSPAENFAWGEDEKRFQSPDFSQETPFIYEAHVGMAQDKEGVGTYDEFRRNVLPRVKQAGYNVLQLMGIAEHPYYGSFGYHVSNFFAPSSRFGSPDDLKALIREAHKMGISVVMDVVHAHFVENKNEGLNALDGADDLYSYAGDRGTHPYWGSRMFNFSRNEVRRFLLSNLRYWVEEFHFDGFRFDGVTAMIYWHRGYVEHFGTYENYFGSQVDEDALIYLRLANDLLAELRPGNPLSIAEEVSGMPGMTAPTRDGGMGFNFRLSMGIPDFWIRLLKEKRDEEWRMEELWRTVNDRLDGVPQIAYVESHDQALVGDQTLAFRLMGAWMYKGMATGFSNPVVDRGMALHKMIRLFTLFAGAEGGGYLNFMGNEFGHPEWIDFPRPGNGDSYRYARRQWHLVDDPGLKYRFLASFDRAMLALASRIGLRRQGFAHLLYLDEGDQTLAFELAERYVFVFNWHPEKGRASYRVPVRRRGKYRLVLCTDSVEFGGFGRVEAETGFFTEEEYLQIYNINRAAQVFALEQS